MDFDTTAKSLTAQFVTVWHAPIPFLTAVLLALIVVWKIVQREFAMRLANADSTIGMLRERLDRTEKGEVIAIAATQQEREPVTPPAASTKTDRDVIAPPTPKQYVRDGITPEYLIGLFEGRTEVQAKAMLADHFGKWMIIEGPVVDVNEFANQSLMVVMRAGAGGLIFSMFDGPNAQVRQLPIGETVRIEGVIDEVKTLRVGLENCSLISGVLDAHSPPH